MNIKGIVYMIRNNVNGKLYIGKSVRSLRSIITRHTNPKSRQVIGRAIQKYGQGAFSFYVIDRARTEKSLNKKEIFWIKAHNCKTPNGYNVSDGGEGVLGIERSYMRTPEARLRVSLQVRGEKHPLYGKHHSEATKRKISRANKGRKASEETRAKLSAMRIGRPSWNKGLRMSEKVCRAISRRNRGCRNPFFGKVHSQQTKDKIAAANRGMKLSPEACAKIGAVHRGVPKSEEHKRKLSLSNKGKHFDRIGVKCTEEHKRKVSEAKKKWWASLSRSKRADHVRKMSQRAA